MGMDKGFKNMLKELEGDFKEIRRPPYNFYAHADIHEREMHGLYLQFKLFKWTKWLVFATWALVIATIILVILN